MLLTLLHKASAFGDSPWQVLTDTSFVSISFLYLIGIVSYIGLLAFIGRKNVRALFAVLCGLAALPMLSLSIGIGGYAFKYILYLTPAVVAV